MVYFSCSGCNESLKKNKVANHLNFCRRCSFLTCLDCQKDFDAESYTRHNQCVTEVERYGGPGYVLPVNANKGQKKQMGWMDSVLMNIGAFLEETKNMKHKKDEQIVMTGLQRYDNIPRKKAKFVNFIKSSFARFRYNEPLIERVWDVISVTTSEEAKVTPASQEPAQKEHPEANGREVEEETKRKKKKGKEDEAGEDGDDSRKTNGDSGDKKKKKKKRKRQDEEPEADEEESEVRRKKKRKRRREAGEDEEKQSRKKKRKREGEEEQETNQDEDVGDSITDSEVQEGEAEDAQSKATPSEGFDDSSPEMKNGADEEENPRDASGEEAADSSKLNGDGGDKKKRKKKKRKMEAEEAGDGESEANPANGLDSDASSPEKRKTADDEKENEDETRWNERTEESKEVESTASRKKKKKKRKRKDSGSEDNAEEARELTPPVKRPKKEYVPEGFQQQRLNETLELETPRKFVISGVVTAVLEDKGEAGISMKKLEKKVLSEYQVSLKEGQPFRPHKISSKLKTVVAKHFRLVNDRVFLRPEV